MMLILLAALHTQFIFTQKCDFEYHEIVTVQVLSKDCIGDPHGFSKVVLDDGNWTCAPVTDDGVVGNFVSYDNCKDTM